MPSLRQKFGLVLAGFAAATGLIVYMGFRTSNAVAVQLAQVKESSVPQFMTASALDMRFSAITRMVEDAVVMGDTALLDESDDEKALFIERLNSLIEVAPESDKVELREIEKSLEGFYANARQLAELLLASEAEVEGLEFLATRETAELGDTVGAMRADLESRLSDLATSRREIMDAGLRSTEEEARDHAQLALTVGLLSLALFMAALAFLTRKIVAPIRALSEMTESVAAGRLDVTIPPVSRSRDEVGNLAESFQKMTKSLQETTVSRDYVDNIIRSMADSLIVLDSKAQITMVNQATSNLLGFEGDELVGRSFREILVPSSTFVESEIGGLVGGGITANLEEGYVKKDGSHIPVSVAAATLTGGNGAVEGYVCVAQDLTERKEIEEDLRRARDGAEQASRTKSAFLANMSHELRTPLNAIIGYAEILQEDAEDEGLDTFVPDLGRITKSGRHLLELINDILDLSKIEAGRTELLIERFAVKELVEDVVGTVRQAAEKNGNVIDVVIADDVDYMVADQTKLRQNLLNLLSNAAKFTEKGRIELSVDVEADPGDAWMVFDVSDTGIGMTQDQKAKVFDVFAQADLSTTRKYGGTGLGLAITKRLCQMMGGDISVQAAVGKGSSFTMRLPREARLASGILDVEDEIESPRHPDTAYVPEDVVLVIDDDPSARDLVSRHLTREGFSVITAADGSEGLRKAREVKPGAITLDVAMPGMDGWKVLEEMKMDSDLATIPVIFLTMVQDQTRGFALGAADYLSKPVDRSRLVSVLRSQIQKTSPRVLIVDDDTSTREIVRRTLAREGWSVSEAENGRQAIEQLASGLPDLIILDLTMPEVDGFEFVEQIQMREEWKNIPIVVLTASTLSRKQSERLNGYVEQVMEKGSYSRESLLALVGELVRRSVDSTITATDVA